MPKDRLSDFSLIKGDILDSTLNVNLMLPVNCIYRQFYLPLVNIGLILAKHRSICILR